MRIDGFPERKTRINNSTMIKSLMRQRENLKRELVRLRTKDLLEEPDEGHLREDIVIHHIINLEMRIRWLQRQDSEKQLPLTSSFSKDAHERRLEEAKILKRSQGKDINIVDIMM